MPFVSIKVAGSELKPAQKDALQAGFTELMGAMRKVPARSTVTIELIAPEDWSIDGAPVARHAAHVEAEVTKGTNSPPEMERFIASAHCLLQTVLGPLPDATYVVVKEIPAEAWGRGGVTQTALRGLRRAS